MTDEHPHKNANRANSIEFLPEQHAACTQDQDIVAELIQRGDLASLIAARGALALRQVTSSWFGGAR